MYYSFFVNILLFLQMYIIKFEKQYFLYVIISEKIKNNTWLRFFFKRRYFFMLINIPTLWAEIQSRFRAC